MNAAFVAIFVGISICEAAQRGRVERCDARSWVLRAGDCFLRRVCHPRPRGESDVINNRQPTD